VKEQTRAKPLSDRVMKVIVIVLCIILIPMLVINLTLIVKSFVNPDEVPSCLGYKPFIVLSGSMEPEFYSGDLILVHEVAKDFKEGDIIAFRQGNSVITHRIQKVDNRDGEKRYITKGDNNNTEDKFTVSDDKIEGIYILKVSGLGNFAFFMQTPIGMMVFIALPLILFILYDIFRRRLYDRREKSKMLEMEEELARMRQQIASTENDGALENMDIKKDNSDGPM